MSSKPTIDELRARIDGLMRLREAGSSQRRSGEMEDQPKQEDGKKNNADQKARVDKRDAIQAAQPAPLKQIAPASTAPVNSFHSRPKQRSTEEKENQPNEGENPKPIERKQPEKRPEKHPDKPKSSAEKKQREKQPIPKAEKKEEENRPIPADDGKKNNAGLKAHVDKRDAVPAPQPASSKQNVSSSTALVNSFHSRPKRSITVNGSAYDILGTLGRGGTSVVYQVVNEQGQVYAIKTVDLSEADDDIRHSYLNEIKLLSKLQGSPHIIKLHAYELQGDYLQVVMEKGDSDLQTYLRNRRSDDQNVKSYTIKFLWGEMLRCVKVIHDKNIVHSDLKPANFLFVNGGHIKLIDFGIAASIPSEQTSAWKEEMMGTLSYMSPEAIIEVQSGCESERNADDSVPKSRYKVPLKSDVWSLGCILYNMIYGRTPFQGVKSTPEKIMAITNPNFKIDFPEIDDKRLLDVMKSCLVRSVHQRASIDQLLHHPYLEDKSGAGDSNPEMDQLLDVLNSDTMTPRTKIKQMTKIAASSSKLNFSSDSNN